MAETVGISIEEWCRLAKEGSRIPVKITLAGTSMEPLIRKDRDHVVIVPADDGIRVGDIVLFRRYDGAYVVHRVYSISENTVVTLGDNCEKTDPPVSRESILGKVTEIIRGRKLIEADSEAWRRIGIISMKMLPLRKRILHLKYVIKKNFGGAK